MKKKGLKTIAVSAVTGCILLSLSAASFANTGSGYGDYKAAVEATLLAKNATISAQYEVTDQGSIILSGNSTQQLDNQDRSSQTSVTVGGVTKAFETSLVDGTLITEADGKYYSSSKGNGKFGGEQRADLSASGSTVKLAEVLANTLVGDVKNQFVENGQTISVNLQGEQIPELAQLAISAAAENSSQRGDHRNIGKQDPSESMKPMMDQIPKLTNIEVKSIAMTATVDGTTLNDNDFTITITGNDSSGVAHEETMKVSVKITDVGSTKIQAIDTTGQQVNTIEPGRARNK